MSLDQRLIDWAEYGATMLIGEGEPEAAMSIHALITRVKRLYSRPRVVVSVIVADDDDRVLLLKRGPYGSYPGMWCLPGGHIEGGEHPREAAARELLEETGLDTNALYVVDANHFDGMVAIVYRAFGYEPGAAHNADPGSHSDIGWFHRRSLPEPMMPPCLWTLTGAP